MKPAAPGWLIFATVALAILILFMAVAETTLWTHFLVDRGEYLSLAGLAFALGVGLRLHRQRRLAPSLALMLPWLLYPVLTQGDEIIDNLTINQMRVVCHVILAALFGTPILVLVMAARHLLAPPPGIAPRRRFWTAALPGLRLVEQGRIREGGILIALFVLLIEMWVAHRYLGTLMILTLVGMGVVILFYAAAVQARTAGLARPWPRLDRERAALAALLIGVTASLGLYVGYKNRPGAYQGSPHYFHDPARKDALYPLEAIAVPSSPLDAPPDEARVPVQEFLGANAAGFEKMFEAYYLMDRNYNYAFHNALFLRETPVVPGFRATGIGGIARAREQVEAAAGRLEEIRSLVPAAAPLGAFLEEVRGYAAFNLRRASQLEEMSGRFERTQAGLQHATHLYEGEGRALGLGLREILAKHRRVIEAPATRDLVASFADACHRIERAYANRIVGF